MNRHDRLDPGELGRGDEVRAHHGQALGVGLAVVAAEEKVDGREQVLGGEGVHDLPRLRLVHLRRPALGEAAAVGASVPASLLAQLAPGAGEIPDQGAGVVYRLVELAVNEVVERERDRPLLMGDEADGAVGAGDPGGDLIGVGDSGREANELDVLWAEDDRFFPGGAPLLIRQVVDLIEDDAVDLVQIPGGLEEHVAEDLGGHHDDASVPVLGDVAGEETDLVTVDGPQVAELLVGEGLDRRGVEDAARPLERLVDAELRDDGLAGASGGGDHDRLALEEGADGLALEFVQRERVHGPELLDLGLDRGIEGGSDGNYSSAARRNAASGILGAWLTGERRGPRRGRTRALALCLRSGLGGLGWLRQGGALPPSVVLRSKGGDHGSEAGETARRLNISVLRGARPTAVRACRRRSSRG